MKHHMWLISIFLCLSCFVVVAQDAAGDAKPEESKPAAAAPATPPTAAATPKGADAVEQTYLDEFIDKIKQGGKTMIFLLLLSVAGIARILERLFNLRSRTFATPGLVNKANDLYLNGQYDELHELCKADKSILGRIILAVVSHRDCEAADVQNLAGDIGSREIRVQLQKAYMLAIIATLSPLLGLFGTVIGMIGAFDIVSQVGEMGDASIMAGSIAKALVTTAGGLVVAMPMLGAYHWFRSRTNQYAIGLEEDVSELFSAWFLKKKQSE